MNRKLSAAYLLNANAAGKIYGPAERHDLAQLLDVVADPREADLLLTGWGGPRMDAAFLAAHPRLQAVFYGAGSVRGIVTDEFWARGLRITSACTMNAVPVAQYTVGAILMSLKHVWHYALTTQRTGQFPPRRPMPGGYDTTVGLISLGTIARLVAQHLRPFALRVIAYDPFCAAAEAQALGVELLPLAEISRQADVVSLHTPWLKETEGLITGAHFESMKSGATFINTARGAIVREAEMIAVAARRPDLTFLLDVTWPEPPVAGSPLYTLPNVVLTPHIAGSQDQECRRMGRFIVDEVRRYLAGEPLRGEVTREQAAWLA